MKNIKRFVWEAGDIKPGKQKGGSRSGHFGHFGRPGYVGGSMPGNVGIYANGEGSPTEKQIAFAKSLIDQHPDWDKYRGQNVQSRARITLAEARVNGKDWSSARQEKYAREIYQNAKDWANSIDLSKMSKRGISSFIDNVKQYSIVRAWVDSSIS